MLQKISETSVKNELGCRDDIVPKAVGTRRHHRYRVESMQQSFATQSLHPVFGGGCGRLLHALEVPSGIYSFWHDVIPTFKGFLHLYKVIHVELWLVAYNLDVFRMPLALACAKITPFLTSTVKTYTRGVTLPISVHGTFTVSVLNERIRKILITL